MVPLPLVLVACGGVDSAAPSAISPTPTTTPTPSPTVTRLEQALNACALDQTYAELGDSNLTLTMDGKGDDDPAGLDVKDIACVMNQLQVTDAVVQHIDQTRALDGMQTDEWPGFKARWTYHPDSGLQIIVQQVATA